MRYDLAVILINYNSSTYTIKCIESILNHTSSSLNYQIIVVDNASETEDVNYVEKELSLFKKPFITFIKSNINVGFGGGNMLGVKKASAHYFAFINNDSLLLNNCLSIIYNAMELNPSYGICGPFCYNEKGEILSTLDHFASPAKEFLGRKILEKINPKRYPNRKIKHTQPLRGEFVSGSFMVVRAKDFIKVGGFDTNIFLYFEETDLCKRLLQINKYAYLIPDAEFIHYHGISTPKNILIKTELKRSYLYIIKKHYGWLWHQIILNKLRFQYFYKSIFKPKYWIIFKELMLGMPMKNSLQYKQKTKS